MTSEPPSRILLLLRHGKAESIAQVDSDRALTEKGKKQSEIIGEYLKSQNVNPSVVLVSPARRTRETWEALEAVLPKENRKVTIVDSLYSGSLSDSLEAIMSVNKHERVVLVVSHEPTMSHLAEYLANDDTSDSAALAQVRIGVPTGSMSVFSSSASSWKKIVPGELTLHTLVRS